MRPDSECACGDVLDEHDPITLACSIDGCECIYFDAADEEDEPAGVNGFEPPPAPTEDPAPSQEEK